MTVSPVFMFGMIVVLYLISSVKILNEYERGVIFRLGKLLPRPKGPGVILVFAPIDRMVRVSLRTIVMDVPPQDVITKDILFNNAVEMPEEAVSFAEYLMSY